MQIEPLKWIDTNDTANEYHWVMGSGLAVWLKSTKWMPYMLLHLACAEDQGQ